MSRSTSLRYHGVFPFRLKIGMSIFSPSIFFWSMIRPLSRAWGVGGQPGI